MSAMRDVDPADAEIIIVPTFTDTGTLHRLATGIVGMLRSALLVLTGRVDIVHVHLAHGGSVIRKAFPLWAARSRGVPSVIHGHSYNFGEWFRSLPGAGQAAVRAALPGDHWLILGTDLAEEYREILRLDPERVTVLHNPAPAPPTDQTAIDPAGTSAGGPGVVMAALGRLGDRKGTFNIIAAVASLDTDVRDRLIVVLAGDGEVDRARDAAAPLGGVVTIRDWLNPDQRDALLAAADVLLLPSYDEGLPMALLEAMSAGIAPITSPVGAIGDVIVDGVNGILVTPGDVPALAAAIESLATDDRRRLAIAAQARATAEEFSVANWHASMVGLWRDLSAAARPRW